MDLWKAALERIRLQVSEHTFNTWFYGTTLYSQKEDSVTVGTPNTVIAKWLEKHHKKLIEDTLASIRGVRVKVAFRSDDQEDYESLPLPFKQDNSLGDVEVYEPNSAPISEGNELVQLAKSPLNPGYTFEAYVVGPSNEFAFAAAQAVTESLGRVYNPLFLWGGVGLGKTHLIHAIANVVIERSDFNRVLYCSCEQFTNDFIQCVRNKQMDSFHRHYRNIDVLLIDDIQFLGRTKGTQEQFFHTFNTLFMAQKQLVMTSDRPPGEIPMLEDRLRSRFQQGVIIDIQPPSFEMRCAILLQKAELLALDLPEDVLFYMANHLNLHVRQLEGCLATLKAMTGLKGRKVTLALAQEAMANFLTQGKRNITFEDILKAVAENFDVPVEDLLSRRRDQPVALYRQVVMYLARELTPLSAKEIAHRTGKRDHSTVLHAISKVRVEREKDEELSNQIETIRATLLEG